jgi:N utilization substance protein A
VVPNDQLSLAIGRQGQNVRLASKLLGWKIDVKSEQRYANLEDAGYQSLLALKGVEEPLADQLFSKDIRSVNDLAKTTVESLIVLRAIDEESAERLIAAATEAVKSGPTYEPEDADLPAGKDEVVSEGKAVETDTIESADTEAEEKK